MTEMPLPTSRHDIAALHNGQPNSRLEQTGSARYSIARSADKVDEDREAEDYPDEAS